MAITVRFTKTLGAVMSPRAFFVVFFVVALFALLVPACAQGGERYWNSSDQRLGQSQDQRLERFDHSGLLNQRVTPERQSQRFWNAETGKLGPLYGSTPPGSKQLPSSNDPSPVVIINNKKEKLVLQLEKIKRCDRSIMEVRASKAILADAIYAKKLLRYDQDCLRSAGVEPNVFDPDIPKRSIVVMSNDGRAFCTGLLLDDLTLATARHCLVVQSTGQIRKEFETYPQSSIDIQTVDLQRRVFLSKETIEGLRLSSSFDIDQDPVKIAVRTSKEPGAQDLPTVVFKTAVPLQLLWVAGPVALLDQALALRDGKFEPGATPPHFKWQDTFRWSDGDSAQCRIKAISAACIYHTCQTTEGYSGTPMISAVSSGASGDVIEYVGVHSGSPGFEADKGWPACSDLKASSQGSGFTDYNVGKSGGF